MDGQQLPKATMANFIKKQTNCPISSDCLSKLLYLSKQFVARLSDKSNVICEDQQKKTINVEHLEAALREFGLTTHLEDLRLIEENIKEHNQLKREASLKFQEMLAKDLEMDRQRRQDEAENQPSALWHSIPGLDPNLKPNLEHFDYQNMQEDQPEVVRPGQ